MNLGPFYVDPWFVYLTCSLTVSLLIGLGIPIIILARATARRGD